ncbi:hypothetical protein J1D01_10705 [Seonamhaeicola sp. NFXS20]|uniref:hypothetical protein n=1 Tax=Seonamhaeicola sp. NFXS20 TaxID=2816959 RepID=UPI003B8B19A8
MEELNFLEQALNKGNGALTVKESRMAANCLDALAAKLQDYEQLKAAKAKESNKK